MKRKLSRKSRPSDRGLQRHRPGSRPRACPAGRQRRRRRPARGSAANWPAQIAADGGRVEWVAGDITDPEVRARTTQTATDCFGGLDLLVNNAGVGAMGLFADADPERVRRIMEVNFFALVEMTRLALPLLKAAVGRCGQRQLDPRDIAAFPTTANTRPASSPCTGFSESIRAELAPLGIDVLVVSPGTTETEFFRPRAGAHVRAQLAGAQPSRPQRPGRWSCDPPGSTRSFPIAGASALLAQPALAADGR